MTHALRGEDLEELDVEEADEDLGGEDLEAAEDDAEEPDEGEERVEAAFEPGSHPRAPAGSDNGGQFTTGNGGGSSSKPAPKKTKKSTGPAKPKPSGPRRKIPDGQLGFDGVSGTGYGKPDDRVKSLQQELNRLHFVDGAGKKLRVDGEFGPLTTDAVKAAQKQLGMNPTGIVDPAFINRLKSLPAPKRTRKTKASRVEAGELRDIELVRPGTWQLSSGEQTFTEQMIRDAARHASRAGYRAPIRLGHNDDRFVAGDGEPALGWLGNLRVVDDAGEPVLIGDITGMPDWLAAAAPTAWPDRSVEGWTDFLVDGEKYSFVIDGLALLGVTPPGIGSIRSLRDLPAALGIAASAQRVVARAPTAARVAATAPAPEAEEPIKKGAGMDPAKIREACGLPADASDDEVTSALAVAGFVPAAPEPVAASIKDAPGTMRVDASAWQEREDRLKRLEAAMQKSREAERDQIIASAVKDGKFAPSRKQHWARLWDADPEGTREVIAGLAKGVMPTSELGYADGETEADEVYAALFGKQKVS